MRPLLYILIPPNIALLTLALIGYLLWIGALIVVSIIALFCVYAVRQHEKHHRSEMFDDRLTTDKIGASTQWLLETWKDNKEDSD